MKLNPINKMNITCLALAVIGFGGSSQAQTVLGSFQGSSDPLNAGWVNPNTGNSITTDPADSFVAAGVPGFAQSLQVTGTAGTFGSDSLQLQFSPAQIAAFNANSYITFTFSVPAWTSGGFSQIFNLALNATGYGYNNQSWANSQTSGNNSATTPGSDPNFFFFNGSPLQSQVVTLNYSSVLPAIEAGGEGFLQMTLQGNQGGGAPAFIYINNVVLSTAPFGVSPVPEPTSMAVFGIGALTGMLALRRRKK
jgi:PEP-CTERM motif